MNLNRKFVTAGEFIGQSVPNIHVKEGVYEKNGKMFSSICGRIKIDIDDSQQELLTYISVVSNQKNAATTLKLGQVIIGKVTKIKEDLCNVKIMLIDEKPISANLEGVIRKQNVRESEVDKLIMEYSFIPGDIVKAKIISLGDSSRVYLSTTGDELGVLFAKDQETKDLMLPFSWNQMISLSTGLKEYRKVAKPNLNLFEAQQQQQQ